MGAMLNLGVIYKLMRLHGKKLATAHVKAPRPEHFTSICQKSLNMYCSIVTYISPTVSPRIFFATAQRGLGFYYFMCTLYSINIFDHQTTFW